MNLFDQAIGELKSGMLEELERRLWERLEPRIEEALFSRMLTIEDAAKYLVESKSTVRRMIRDHQIPAIKIRGEWRIPLMELDDLIRRKVRERMQRG